MKTASTFVLLTGATGFIGSWVLRELLAKDYHVRVLLRNPSAELLKDNRIEHYIGDIRDADSLQGIEKNIDWAIHCAAMLGKWGDDDADLFRTNVEGSLNLFKQFSNTGLEKFIYLSAGGVTGPLNGKIGNENSICKPATAYEKSKREAEKKLAKLSKQLDLPLLIVRPTFTYGPTDKHKSPLFVAVKKARFAFIGSGKTLLSPVYITDLVDGLFLALKEGQDGETYIISGEQAVSKQQLIYCIADELGVSRPVIKIPYFIAWNIAIIMESLGKKFNFQPVITCSKVMMMGDDFSYSIDKAKKELNYLPRVSLKQGIKNTVAYYRKQGWLDNCNGLTVSLKK